MNAYTSSMANYGGAANAVSGMMQDVGGGEQQQHQQQHQQPQQPLPHQAAPPLSLPTGGIRTAFHTGQPPAPKKPKVELAPVPTMPQQHQHQQQYPAMMMAQPPLQQPQVTSTGVALPVGVGIRLGGPGGIAPATAQNAARAPGIQGQYMWGATNTNGTSDQAVVERRQRNREHAKRSRVRKKFMLESLQGEVRQLQKENQRLRLIVQEHIPENAMQIIVENCSTSPLFSDDDPNDPNRGHRKAETLAKSDYSLMQSLTTGQQCFVLSDPKLPDNPIVFATPGFYKLTGYTPKEVLGRNCRFLQGPGTNPKAVDIIRKAIQTGADATVCLLNYKADGSPFWNQFFIAALRDSDNCIVNYVRWNERMLWTKSSRRLTLF